MTINQFNFILPKNLIASRPAVQRDHSRLLILHPNGKTEHRYFYNIPEYLDKGDLLLLNDTKVFPALIVAQKPSGGMLDILFVKHSSKENIWEVMYRGNYEGVITLHGKINAQVWIETDNEKHNRRKKLLEFLTPDFTDIHSILWKYGNMPLPRYISRHPDNEDMIRYQTVYAKKTGSIAAPTAGLHFTPALLQELNEKGVLIRTLTLHVGIGTFKPIRTESVDNHKMEAEFFEIEHSLEDEIKKVRKSNKRVYAVGTTSTRAIEGFMSGIYTKSQCFNTKNQSICGYTDIFIYPGYVFKAVNCLITNFHLPRSTPLLLVSAISGWEKILKAYNEAISLNYRFFSYGDAMLIL